MATIDFEAQDKLVKSKLRYRTWYSNAELCELTGMKEYEVRDSLSALWFKGLTLERCRLNENSIHTRVYALYFDEEA